MQLLGPYQYTYIGGGYSVTRTWRLLKAQAGCVLATVCSEMFVGAAHDNAELDLNNLVSWCRSKLSFAH